MVGFEMLEHGDSARQARPDTRTQRVAANSVLSGGSGTPPRCGRTRDGGISGSAISHNPPGTIQLHVSRPVMGPATTSPHGARSY